METAAETVAGGPAEDPAAAADAAVREAQPADPAAGVLGSSAGIKPLTACMQDKHYTGASAPRTGITDNTPVRAFSQHTATPSTALPLPSVAPANPHAGAHRGSPARHLRPASAPPTASTTASPSGTWAGAGGNNRGAYASPSQSSQQLPNGHAQHLHPRGVPTKADANVELPTMPHGQANGKLALLNGNSQLTEKSAASGDRPHEQSNAAPAVAHQQQNGHQQADVNSDNDSLEDGEIEEGEVLPDGTVAGGTSSAPFSVVVHDVDHNGFTDDSGTSVITKGSHKRSAPDSPDASSLHAAKRHAKPI